MLKRLLIEVCDDCSMYSHRLFWNKGFWLCDRCNQRRNELYEILELYKNRRGEEND